MAGKCWQAVDDPGANFHCSDSEGKSGSLGYSLVDALQRELI